MKFNKYVLLLGCLVLLLGTSFVCAHDISHISNQKGLNTNNLLDLTNSVVSIYGNSSDGNGSSDFLGVITIHVYNTYNRSTHKFEGPIKGAKCSIYGWDEHKLVDSQTTDKKSYCFVEGKPLSRYHLEVKYPNGQVIKCDIPATSDVVSVSPTYILH